MKYHKPLSIRIRKKRCVADPLKIKARNMFSIRVSRPKDGIAVIFHPVFPFKRIPAGPCELPKTVV